MPVLTSGASIWYGAKRLQWPLKNVSSSPDRLIITSVSKKSFWLIGFPEIVTVAVSAAVAAEDECFDFSLELEYGSDVGDGDPGGIAPFLDLVHMVFLFVISGLLSPKIKLSEANRVEIGVAGLDVEEVAGYEAEVNLYSFLEQEEEG